MLLVTIFDFSNIIDKSLKSKNFKTILKCRKPALESEYKIF